MDYTELDSARLKVSRIALGASASAKTHEASAVVSGRRDGRTDETGRHLTRAPRRGPRRSLPGSIGSIPRHRSRRPWKHARRGEGRQDPPPRRHVHAGMTVLGDAARHGLRRAGPGRLDAETSTAFSSERKTRRCSAFSGVKASTVSRGPSRQGTLRSRLSRPSAPQNDPWGTTVGRRGIRPIVKAAQGDRQRAGC